jgi:hypothetical protein
MLDLVAEGESVAARSQFRGTQVGSMGSYPLPARCFRRPVLLSIAWKEGALPKHGQNGTTCMGCNNSAITMQRNLLMEEFSPFGQVN